MHAGLLAYSSNLCCADLVWPRDVVFQVHLIAEIHLACAYLKKARARMVLSANQGAINSCACMYAGSIALSQERAMQKNGELLKSSGGIEKHWLGWGVG